MRLFVAVVIRSFRPSRCCFTSTSVPISNGIFAHVLIASVSRLFLCRVVMATRRAFDSPIERRSENSKPKSTDVQSTSRKSKTRLARLFNVSEWQVRARNAIQTVAPTHTHTHKWRPLILEQQEMSTATTTVCPFQSIS